MNTSYRSFGLFGLIILAFGLVGGLITSNWTSRYVLVHLILGVALLVLYLFTHIESLKESVSGRQARYGTNTVVYSLLTLAVLGLINYLGAQHAFRYDATAEGIFSIAPQTTQVLDSLDRDIHVYAFFREAEGEPAERLLDSFAAESERFGYTMVDPDKRPEMAERYEVTQYGTLVLAADDESTRITETTEEALTNALIRFTSARTPRIYFTEGHGEPDIQGRQQVRDYGLLTAALENEGNEVEALLLATVPDVPADADLLVVAAPQRPFLEQELEVLGRYLDRGGKALFLLEPRESADLVALLAERGIEVANDIVVDQVMRLFAGPSLGLQPVVQDYGFHPITEEFTQQTIFNGVRSVEAAAELPDGITVTTLVRTGPNSWAESDLERLYGASEAALDDDDQEGPVSIAVAATLGAGALEWTQPLIETKPGSDTAEEGGDEVGAADADAVGEGGDEEAGAGAGGAEAGDETPTDVAGGGDEAGTAEPAGADQADQGAQGAQGAGETGPPADLEGRIVVFGDADWVNNQNLTTGYNEDLVLNATGWLVGEEDTIAIRPRSRRASRITLTAMQQWAVFYTAVLLLPEVVLLVGIGIWWRRRR